MVFVNCISVFCAAVIVLASTKEIEAAQQISRIGSFELPCSPEDAFPLFSPEGERGWVPGWDPQPVFPATIAFARDTVFREGKGDQEATWTIVDADCQTHRAEYIRLAPASHAAHIVVKVEPLGQESSSVTVTYTVTAFGEHARSLLENFSAEAYAEKMQNWQRWIAAYLKSQK